MNTRKNRTSPKVTVKWSRQSLIIQPDELASTYWIRQLDKPSNSFALLIILTPNHFTQWVVRMDHSLINSPFSRYRALIGLVNPISPLFVKIGSINASPSETRHSINAYHNNYQHNIIRQTCPRNINNSPILNSTSFSFISLIKHLITSYRRSTFSF